MRFTFRKLFLLTGIMVMLAFVLTACGGSELESEAAPAAEEAAPAAEEAAPAAEEAAPAAEEAADSVKLTIWHNAADSQPFIDVFQRWADETGNEIELVALPADGFENQVLTRWAAGERPDILEYHATGFQQFNPTENLQELNGMAFIENAPTIYPALGTQDGITYAAVTAFPTVFGLFYNKQVLADAGLEIPETFADLEEICATLQETNPDIIPIWESGGSLWPLQVLPAMYLADHGTPYGDSMLARETTADDPDGAFVDSLVTYDNLMQSGCFGENITTAQFEESVQAVADGRAAMTALHSAVVPMFNAALGDDTSATDSTIGFAYPASESAYAWWAPGPMGTYYAPKTGDPAREAAALDFIRYATGEGYQQTIDESQTFPVIEGFNNPSGAQGLTVEIKDAFDTSSGLPWNVSFPPGIQFDQLMGTLISGEATPLEVSEQFQLQLEQGAKAAGLPGWD